MNRYQTLNIVLTLAIVLALAFLTAHIIGYRIGRLIPVGKGSGPVAQSTPTPEDFSSFAPILEKGFFGKATIGKLTPLVKEAATTGAAAATPVTDLVLLGTALGSFRETFALVQKTSSKEERVFRLGRQQHRLRSLRPPQEECSE